MNRFSPSKAACNTSNSAAVHVDARAQMLVDDQRSWADFQKELVLAGVATNFGVLEVAQGFLAERFHGQQQECARPPEQVSSPTMVQRLSATFFTTKDDTSETDGAINLHEIGRCPVQRSLSNNFTPPERRLTDPSALRRHSSLGGENGKALGSILTMSFT